jgi:hypothetical protein
MNPNFARTSYMNTEVPAGDQVHGGRDSSPITATRFIRVEQPTRDSVFLLSVFLLSVLLFSHSWYFHEHDQSSSLIGAALVLHVYS